MGVLVLLGVGAAARVTWIGDAGDGRSSPVVVQVVGMVSARRRPWVVGTSGSLLFVGDGGFGSAGRRGAVVVVPFPCCCRGIIVWCRR